MDADYELPKHNVSDEDLQHILQTARVIAVVGLSRNHEADSYQVASYLQEHGYRIIPVHPRVKEILNEKCYDRLEDIPEKVDVVNVFRRSEEVAGIIESSIAIGAKTVWTQKRIVDNVAAIRAIEAGLQTVMNKCVMKEHKRYEIDISL